MSMFFNNFISAYAVTYRNRPVSINQINPLLDLLMRVSDPIDLKIFSSCLPVTPQNHFIKGGDRQMAYTPVLSIESACTLRYISWVLAFSCPRTSSSFSTIFQGSRASRRFARLAVIGRNTRIAVSTIARGGRDAPKFTSFYKVEVKSY